jgi:hypothetical protein
VPPGGDFSREGGVGTEGGLHVGGEAAVGIVGQQLALGRVGVALAGLQRAVRVDLPHAVVLEPPEGVLGVVGLPGRPELLEQWRQVAVHLAEGDVAPLPARPAAEGVQHQQRLVRGALAPAAPDVEPVE